MSSHTQVTEILENIDSGEEVLLLAEYEEGSGKVHVYMFRLSVGKGRM